MTSQHSKKIDHACFISLFPASVIILNRRWRPTSENRLLNAWRWDCWIPSCSFPLAIAAVEHYRDGLDPLKDYFRYDSTLKSLRTRLRIQQDLFEGTLKRLLLEELSATEARALFADASQYVDKVLWDTIEVD